MGEGWVGVMSDVELYADAHPTPALPIKGTGTGDLLPPLRLSLTRPRRLTRHRIGHRRALAQPLPLPIEHLMIPLD